jgi:hypothetical protein
VCVCVLNLSICLSICRYDVLIITPTRMENHLAESVKRCGCYPTTLGEAPYPPKFEPMRPSFRVCWHKLRLFLLTQYQAIVALDSDIVVLSNIDELIDKVIAEPGDANFWMAAHDETPLCEKCGAEVSGAPNAGVFGLRPSRMMYLFYLTSVLFLFFFFSITLFFFFFFLQFNSNCIIIAKHQIFFFFFFSNNNDNNNQL